MNVPAIRKGRSEGLLWAGFLALLLVLAGLGIGPILRGDTGDFVHFHEAARALHDGRDPYESGSGGYIYPAFLAYAMQPLALLERPTAASLWLVVNTALLGCSIAWGAREMRRRLGEVEPRWLFPAAALLALALTADKVRAAIYLGQTDALMIACWVFALIFLDRKPTVAGFLIGIAGGVKYVALLAIPYFILRRRWRAAATATATFAGTLLLPALTVGWNTNLGYLGRAFAGLGRMVGAGGDASEAANIHGLAWPRSVSVTSALARGVETFGGGRGLVLAGVAVVALIVLAAAAWTYRHERIALWRRVADEPESRPPRTGVVAVEWVGLAVAALAFSPQTTARHMVLLVLLHLLAAVVLMSPRVAADRFRVIGALVLMQAALILPPGGQGLDHWVNAWRAVGGAGWCSLIVFVLLLGPALRTAKRAA